MTPTIEHLLFIPATLLAGGALGFIFGVKLVRREFERQSKERRK